MNITVAKERTGFRDFRLSLRHRCWGAGCPTVDIDFINGGDEGDQLFLEYNWGKGTAFVEYKLTYAGSVDLSRSNYQAYIETANSARKPLICARYEPDFSSWTISPLNEYARLWITEEQVMTEREWVELLYKMRGNLAPKSFFDNLFQTIENRFQALLDNLPEYTKEYIGKAEEYFSKRNMNRNDNEPIRKAIL